MSGCECASGKCQCYTQAKALSDFLDGLTAFRGQCSYFGALMSELSDH